jgi:hypothetical protein
VVSLQGPEDPDQAVLATAGPIDATQRAAFVAVASPTKGSDAVLFVGAVRSQGGSNVIVPSERASGGLPTLAGVTVAQDGQLSLLDVDGDGLRDLVVLTGPSPTGGFCTHFTDVTRSLLVYWNKGGAFDTQHPSTVATCNIACGHADVGTFSGQTCPGPFTLLQTSGSTSPTLAYVTAAQKSGATAVTTAIAFAGTVAPKNHALRPATTPSAPRFTPDGGVLAGGPVSLPTTSIDAISSGDIDGDGIDDFAILAKGILYLYKGVSVQP